MQMLLYVLPFDRKITGIVAEISRFSHQVQLQLFILLFLADDIFPCFRLIGCIQGVHFAWIKFVPP